MSKLDYIYLPDEPAARFDYLDFIALVEKLATSLSDARTLRSMLALGVDNGFIFECHRAAVLATLCETKELSEGWICLAKIIWRDSRWGWKDRITRKIQEAKAIRNS